MVDTIRLLSITSILLSKGIFKVGQKCVHAWFYLCLFVPSIFNSLVSLRGFICSNVLPLRLLATCRVILVCIAYFNPLRSLLLHHLLNLFQKSHCFALFFLFNNFFCSF